MRRRQRIGRVGRVRLLQEGAHVVHALAGILQEAELPHNAGNKAAKPRDGPGIQHKIARANAPLRRLMD